MAGAADFLVTVDLSSFALKPKHRPVKKRATQGVVE
jgi:hypothetical protein